MSANDLYAIPSEYNDLRESVKALAAKEIAPYASAVDEEHRFPQEAADALLKAGLSAAHVPTEFGGEGADALAVVIIIEEAALQMLHLLKEQREYKSDIHQMT